MRRNERTGRIILSALIVVLSVPDNSFAFSGMTEITGRLVIGETRYELRGSIQRPTHSDAYVVDLDLGMARKHVRKVHLDVSPSSATLRIGDTAQAVPAETAAQWFKQLDTAFRSLAEARQFEKRILPDGLIALDAVQPFVICPGVEGRMRLRYAPVSGGTGLGRADDALCPRCRMVGVEFFSLGEWENAFGEYVAFTMNFEGEEP